MITNGYYLRKSGSVVRIDSILNPESRRPSATYCVVLMRERRSSRGGTSYLDRLSETIARPLSPEEISLVTTILYVNERMDTKAEQRLASESYETVVRDPKYRSKLSSIYIPLPNHNRTRDVLRSLIDKGIFTPRGVPEGFYRFRESINGWNGYFNSKFLENSGTSVVMTGMTHQEEVLYERLVEQLLPAATNRFQTESRNSSIIAKGVVDLAEAIAKEWIGRRRMESGREGVEDPD